MELNLKKINDAIPYDEGKVCEFEYADYSISKNSGFSDLEQLKPTDIILYKKQCDGGWRGGNCWGDKPYKYEGEEVAFHAFDLILNQIFPSITYLQYKKLLKEIKKYEIYDTNYEYYGNSTDWKYEVIVLEDLLEYIKNIENNYE